MTKKLEEEFNLAPMSSDYDDQIESEDDTHTQIQTIEDALTISEKINNALAEVKGMEVHDDEMDEIATEAMDAFKQLMSLGHNMTDMAAGPVFGNAQQMLKVALEARDSKVNRKLKQIDLLLKKARLDQAERKLDADTKDVDDEENVMSAKTFDRNELLRLLNQKPGE